MRAKVCPISGPGKLSPSARRHRAKEIIAASGADSVEHFEKVVQSLHGVTFREQAITWLDRLKDRKRKPVAPSTIESWECALEKWLHPNIGDMPLDAVNNLAMKELVRQMVTSGLAPKTIANIAQVAKMVVASAVDGQGEELYPRKWNHEFIDLPVVKKNEQRRPSLTNESVTAIVKRTKQARERMLFVLCAASGLRLGEALGIDVKNVSPDRSTITICQKAWKGQLHNYLKTPNGKREIDLHSSVAVMLKSFIGRRESGLLFTTRTGKQLPQSNVLRRVLHPILVELNLPKCGAHAFRRFRLTWLRMNYAPKDLEHFWMGHADEEIGDTYSKLKELVSFRKEWTEKIGLGFDVPSKIIVIGPNGPNQEKGPAGEVQQALVNQ